MHGPGTAGDGITDHRLDSRLVRHRNRRQQRRRKCQHPRKLGGAYSVDYHPVSYPGAIWPVSGLTAPTFKTSVAEGRTNLNDEVVTAGNQPITIVGYSLGAVVVSKSHSDLLQRYPDGNPNIQFVLMGSANTPNGASSPDFPGSRFRWPISNPTALGNPTSSKQR